MDNLQKEIMIQAVRNYPCLYQINKKSNKDLLMKENAWKKIAELLYDVDESNVEKEMIDNLKYNFKNLRDRYMKIKRTPKKPSGSDGPGGSEKSQWDFYNSLKFLDPYIEHKDTVSNFDIIKVVL